MKDQLITLETANLAKNKKFNINCDFKIDQKSEYHFWCDDFYPNNSEFSYDPENDPAVIEFEKWRKTLSEAPTQSLLQKWLREIHKIDVQSYATASGYAYMIEKSYYAEDISGGTSIRDSGYSGPNDGGKWETYEESLECGLCEALKLIKI